MGRPRKALETITTEPTNGIIDSLNMGIPYRVEVTLQGTSDMIFHRWSCDDVEIKSKAAKNSATKKTDNVDSYVYRDDKDQICIPGVYLQSCLLEAAKYRQDPRSPRKSARDLYKAGVIVLDPLSPIIPAGNNKPCKDWDYLDRRRVVIQRSAITRTRPSFCKGWRATFIIQVLLPEYIDKHSLHACLTDAGRFVGLADQRPTYGRFQIDKFEVLPE